MINQNISFYSKSQTLIIASIIVGMTINTSSTSQPATKQHTYIHKSVCEIFSYGQILQKTGTLLRY